MCSKQTKACSLYASVSFDKVMDENKGVMACIIFAIKRKRVSELKEWDIHMNFRLRIENWSVKVPRNCVF